MLHVGYSRRPPENRLNNGDFGEERVITSGHAYRYAILVSDQVPQLVLPNIVRACTASRLIASFEVSKVI